MGECMNYVGVTAGSYDVCLQYAAIGEEFDYQYLWYDIHCPSYIAVLLFFLEKFLPKKKVIPKKESATKYDGHCRL